MIGDQQKKHTAYICIMLILAYGIIICNLFFTQIYNHTFFTELATQQYHVVLKKRPERAFIYDRAGTPLTFNNTCLSAFIMPIKLRNAKAVCKFLTSHFPDKVSLLHAKETKPFMFIKRRLTSDEIELISSSELDDIHFLTEEQRWYPHPACASVVGITDIDNCGTFGIEKMSNEQLQGKPTVYILQKDARSGYFYVKRKIKDIGYDGKSVILTLDATLQYGIDIILKNEAEKLGATCGSVTIMNPDTGDLIVLASYPSCDPNNSRNLMVDHMKNNALTECYEPGSIMKIFTALAALTDNAVTIQELIDCKNTKTAYVGGRLVNTWKAFGILPFYDVIAYSNNIGIAIIAQRLQEKLFDHYIRCGFGKKTGINFPGEPEGFVNNPNRWSKQSVISLSYGYEIMVTPVQIARAFALLCNGGYLVEPRLIQTNPIQKNGPLYNPEILLLIQNILEKTTLYGTSKKAALSGYEVYAKTGSASTLIDGQYTDTQGNYTCAGFLRKNKYQRVIVVHMHIPNSKEQYASTLVAPLWKKIAEALVIHDNI